MNTKQASEIRKGIVFANKLQHAILITKDTKLRHYYWAWYDTWVRKASELSIRAFWRRTERLEQVEWARLMGELIPLDARGWKVLGQSDQPAHGQEAPSK